MIVRRDVGVAGDWHGNLTWAVFCVGQLADVNVDLILHAGDFGIWPGVDGRAYLDGVEQACAGRGVTILVTPGNHEDWDRIDRHLVEDRNDGFGAVKWLTDHVAVLPRAHRFAIATPEGITRQFVSLGGAPSVDYEYRAIGKSWWLTEAITADDVAATIAGGPADVMLTHDSPDGGTDEVAAIIKGNPIGWSKKALTYAAAGRALMTEAFHGVTPKLLIHGHYHVLGQKVVTIPGATHETSVVSLNLDGEDGNLGILDLESLTVGLF